MGVTNSGRDSRAPARHAAGALFVLAAGPLAAAGSDARPPVVVVLGDLAGDGGQQSLRDAQAYCAATCAALEAGGVPYEQSGDTAVERFGLPASCKVAVLPYNRAVSQGEDTRLQAFAAAGGRLIVCFLAPDSILRLCGVESAGIREAAAGGQFAVMRAGPDPLPGFPPQVNQDSWAIRSVRPLPGARILAQWCNLRGEEVGAPAVVLGDAGAFVSHVLLPGDREAKGALLRALAGHFAPEIWGAVATAQLAAVQRTGSFGTIAELIAALQARQARGEPVQRCLGAAQNAQALVVAARDAYHAANLPRAAQLAADALQATRQACYGQYPSKPGELRACWVTYAGTPTWQDTMRGLREANLNAAFPRMASAGVAYYRSSVLPLAGRVATEGDALADACLWGRRYGIAVHPRMLALFVYEADPAVLEAFRDQGRLMQTASGGMDRWLCPTNPKNRSLVIRAALELATRYDSAGVQFDYLRYPGAEYCFCPRCRRQFEHDAGIKVQSWPLDCTQGMYRGRWADWRREQITSLVREVAQRVRRARPEALLSAAVFLNWESHREEFGQDWKQWVDEGIVDFVCPMDYTGNMSRFQDWVTRQRGWVAGKVPLVVGIGPSVPECGLTPLDTVSEVHRARQLGADGFALFQYDENVAANYLPVLAAGATATPTTFSLEPPALQSAAQTQAGRTHLEAVLLPRSPRPGAATGGPAPHIEEAGLAVYTSAGERVLDLGPVGTDLPVQRDASLAAGTYRLAAQGWLSLPQGGQREFVRWGPFFEVP